MAPLVAKMQSGYVEFWWKGNNHSLRSTLSQVPAGTDPDGYITSGRWDVAMIDRDFAAASQALQASGVDEISYTPAGSIPTEFSRRTHRAGPGQPDRGQQAIRIGATEFRKGSRGGAVERRPSRQPRLVLCIRGPQGGRSTRGQTGHRAQARIEGRGRRRNHAELPCVDLRASRRTRSRDPAARTPVADCGHRGQRQLQHHCQRSQISLGVGSDSRRCTLSETDRRLISGTRFTGSRTPPTTGDRDGQAQH